MVQAVDVQVDIEVVTHDIPVWEVSAEASIFTAY